MKCYACTADATNWEHAPPKGFYPKLKETYHRGSAANYRRNLIEVPSCEARNNPKSASDGYTRGFIAIMAASYRGDLNSEAIRANPFLRQQIETVQRGSRLRDTFIEGARPLVSSPYSAIEVDTDALHEVIEAAARALYYYEHQFARRWEGACHIVSPHFRYRDLRVPEYNPEMIDVIVGFESSAAQTQKELGSEKKGPHPAIFYHQKIEHGSTICMNLVFYGAFYFQAFGRSCDPTSDEEQRPESGDEGTPAGPGPS